MEAAAELAQRLRAAANDRLAGQEPLLLVAAPLLALLAARAVHAAAADVADRGLRTVLITLAMAAVKLVPGVSGYIAAEKSKVVEKLQSGSASSKKNLRTELPAVGIPDRVIGDLQALKDKDVRWQGKCSGTVYMHLNDTMNSNCFVLLQFQILLYCFHIFFFMSNKRA